MWVFEKCHFIHWLSPVRLLPAKLLLNKELTMLLPVTVLDEFQLAGEDSLGNIEDIITPERFIADQNC